MSDHSHRHDELEDHDLGLSHDLPTLLGRRRALSVFGLGGAGLLGLAACGSDGIGTATDSSAANAPQGAPPTGGPGSAPEANSSVQVAEGEIPEETNGPYPADGSNGVNVLTQTGIVRSDITTSFGSATGTAQGVPMKLKLKIINMNGDDVQPYAGAAVYVWHCTSGGEYSLYSEAIKDENYLRGVQQADANGLVTFHSIFPACYSGRWPHVHFEVYPSLAKATSASDRLRTSQVALPKPTCQAVYATDGYSRSVANLSQVSLDGDNVFGDGYSLQLGTVTGSVPAGVTVSLNVPV